MSDTEKEETDRRLNFLETLVEEDLASDRDGGRIATRFPPEPNGYLHIGHAKAICINFGIAKKYGGTCNLRFDDTNPTKEDTEYVDSIKADVNWLGWEWDGEVRYASDYFEQLYSWAEELIEKKLAYVCDLNQEETREHRGTATSPGTNSPHRERSVEENLDLFRRMRAGEFADGACALKAKIDMASPNFNMRDPVLYRILHAHHHRTGDAWCIYPMYDFTHGQSDAIEGITHSLCSLEFENHKPLYEWFLERLSVPHQPRQTEFARLKLTYTMMSKRKLRELVEAGTVGSWDDPRMPTISGMRRRGYTPAAVRSFIENIGVARFNSTIDLVVLENAVREDLNKSSQRRMAVLDPVKVVITNYPEGESETIQAVNNPEDESAGKREIPFGREIWIDREDFKEEAPKKFFRLAPGREVRLRYAYCITCEEVIKDSAGNITELRCSYDPLSANGQTADGRKVKGIIHWTPLEAVDLEVRLYDNLFCKPDPDDAPEGEDWRANL
ncbi:MAG: glutamine--tRNA ligase/YqeY domain fusion protein, partial [Planctomycetota bacterium]|nr:glutamine--tRNA ligase/YqeY domain fusion protein [Planctomycetota bacterium]